MRSRIYLLDSNVFIHAARQYYAFDLVPSFWEGLEWHAREGRVRSIDRVRDELKRGKDDLWDWARNHFSHGFASADDSDVLQAYGEIAKWAYGQSQFSRAARDAFFDGADGWLVAYARAKGCIMVTHETFDKHAKRRIKIPNACKAFGIPYMNTFGMLRKLGGLGSQASATFDDDKLTGPRFSE